MATYSVVQVISAGVNNNGRPLPHLENRMKKAKESLVNGGIQKILIGNRIRSLADSMRSYLESELSIPSINIDTFYGGCGTAGELLHGRKKVEQIASYGGYESYYFTVITTDWASERTRLISDWVLGIGRNHVIGVPDGRMDWIKDKTKRMLREGSITDEEAERWIAKVDKDIKNDLYLEPVKASMYRLMSKIPLVNQNTRLLDISEPLISVLYPSLFLTYAKEFSKKLRGQEVYRITEDIYS